MVGTLLSEAAAAATIKTLQTISIVFHQDLYSGYTNSSTNYFILMK